MRHRSTLIAVLFFLLFFSFCRISFADGFYLPDPYVKLPDIPVQRALLKYRDGVETLIVESTLDGPGQKFGWIIPVPSIPQRFEKITPGLLKTLSFALQPRIAHHVTHSRGEASQRSLFAFLFIVWAILMFLSCPYMMHKGYSGPWSIIKFDIWLAIIMFVGAPIFIMFVHGFFAAYRSSGSLPEPISVRVESRQVIGNYELSVLKAGKSSDLNTWLEDNGFSLIPEKAVPIVDAYIAKQWAFVAAKIHREGEGTATPHPILIEFKTDRPVYPMRLTALSGSPVHLELFALASKEAVPVGYDLQKQYCDYFDYESSSSHHRFGKEFVLLYAARANRDVSRFFIDTIGHPIAMKLMWNGCVLTKLVGEVSNDQMKEDMFFSLKKAAPYRSHVYSTQWVVQRGLIVAIVIGLFGLQGLCFLKTRKTVSLRSFPALLIVCVAIFSAIYFSYEKVEVTSQISSADWMGFRMEVEALMADYQNGIYEASDDEIIEHVTSMTNILTNENVVIEDSPGNIIWERKYGELFFTIYLPNGEPLLCYPRLEDFSREDLIAALNDEFSEIRYEAARVLGDRKDPRAVDALVAALEDKNWWVRLEAASSLWKTSEDSRAIELLITALKNPDSKVRMTAASSLGAIKEHGTVEYLIARLKDPDSNVRVTAALALGSIKSHRAIAPLRSAFRDGDSYLQSAAAKALGAIDQPQAVEALIDGLKDVDPNKRKRAAEAFNKTKDPRAVESLITLLNDEVWWVRRSAAEALGKIGDHKAVEPLSAALKDGNEQVRIGAASALAQMNEIELLINALKHGEDTERECAALVLGWQKDTQTATPFIAALEDENYRVRRYAAQALGDIKDPRAIEPLIAALEDDSPFVRKSSSMALKRFTGINPDREPAKWQHWLEKNKVKLKH